MKIKKIGHSCLVIDVNGVKIMTDPGSFTTEQNLEINISAILITHEHGDHYSIESLQAILKNNPEAKIYTNDGVGKKLTESNLPYIEVQEGNAFSVGGVTIDVYGKDHAVVYKTIPIVHNTGFLIDKKLFHPGDALYKPNIQVDILALPVVAPWLKFSEMIDYALEVKPRIAFPIHDGYLATFARSSIGMLPAMILKDSDTQFVKADDGEEIEV